MSMFIAVYCRSILSMLIVFLYVEDSVSINQIEQVLHSGGYVCEHALREVVVHVERGTVYAGLVCSLVDYHLVSNDIFEYIVGSNVGQWMAVVEV